MSELEKLYIKYSPRRYYQGGLNEDDNANPTDLPVIPQIRSSQPEPAQDVQQLAGKYLPEQQNAMWQDYIDARNRVKAENQALRQSLEKHISEQPIDKSEMYFRLAAALAAPTKTQGFGEPMARAAEALAESSASERAQRQANALAALKARQGMAELASTEAKDIGELASKYTKGNTPLSSAGKQAVDEGLRPGTPEYTKRIREISAQNQLVSPVALANLGINQDRLKLERQKAQEASDERSRKASKLSPTELSMKSSTQEQLNALQEMEQQLVRAYDLSGVAFDNSLPDLAQRKALEVAGSSNDKLTSTLDLEKILGGQTLAQGQQMKGTLSDSDIKLLSGLSGAAAKSKKGRDAIILESLAAVRRGLDKTKQKLGDIQTGAYSTYEEAQ